MKLLKREICFSLALFPVVFLAVGILLFAMGFTGYQEYKLSVDVSAIVAECEYDTWYDTDDMPQSEYDIYVDYTYNGTKYTNVYWKSQSNPIDIGKSVTIKLHPDEPGKPFSSNPFTLMIIGAPFAIFGLIMLFKLIPASISDPEIIGFKTTGLPKSKKRYLFVIIPIVAAIIFFIIGLNISPLFHIGTIIFTYFTIVLLEMLK